MSCNCESCSESNSSNESNVRGNHCVADVVRGIVKAQHRAVEAEEDTCFTGCDRSIEELLSPFEENRDRLRHNTIPFILTCKGDCKPFVGSGVHKVRRGGRVFFDCVESPIFRAKSFVRNSETCVRLELLVPVREGGRGGSSEHSEQVESEHESRKDCNSNHGTVCDFFPRNTRNFRATGICITVDLNCFCGISCLSPITPISARGLNEEI